MRTLLHKIDDGLFFCGPGQWTADPRRALDFRFIDCALSYVENWPVGPVELAFAFDQSRVIKTAALERAAVRCSWRH